MVEVAIFENRVQNNLNFQVIHKFSLLILNKQNIQFVFRHLVKPAFFLFAFLGHPAKSNRGSSD